MPDNAYTPMPLPVLAALRHLSGEEFKLVGALCYYTYTQSMAQVTVEQLQAFSGVSRQQVKPLLHRLIHRGWVVPDAVGGFYRLALQPPSPPALESITYDTALGIRPPRPKCHLLYPEGPWLTEAGLLNEDFVRDRAHVWRTGDTYQAKAFGAMAIEDVMGAVCKHYAKPDHHVNLEIDWQSYCLKNQRYLANVQQRLQSGAVIQPQEQATVLKKLPILQQQTLPLYEPASTPSLPEPNLETSVQPIEVNWKALLPDRPMPSSQPRERLPEVDQLRLWLADPILRQEAEQRALSRGYNLVYSETGVAIDILESA